MPFKEIIKKVFGIFFLQIAFTSFLFACMYGPPFATVCQKYKNSDAIVIATLGQVITEEAKGEQRVNLQIEKVFKGNLPDQMILHHFLSTCDWDFGGYSGEKMLLYLRLNKDNKTYSAIGTGYGGKVKDVSADLYWLNDVNRSMKRTIISGEIGLYKDELDLTSINFLSDTIVSISDGKRTFVTNTDINGVYQFWDIPYGRYKITPKYEDNQSLKISVQHGNISWKKLTKNRVDLESFDVIINKKSMCGGANYILNQKNETDHP